MPSSKPSISLIPSIADVEEDCTLCTSSTLITESGNDFRTKVSECIDGTCPEGVPIGCWNTSDVTDMSYAFKATGSFENTYFNTSINCWNTARVTTMAGMFFGASNFNQPLDDWNVASVTDMFYMFQGATNFNQPLDDWNVASVNYMSGMFEFARDFNQPLDDWNVASVTDMGAMFYRASHFNQCLSSWAGKVLSNVNVRNIFVDSGCPNKYPDPSVGPWCQGEDEQCFAPSESPSISLMPSSSNMPSSKPSISLIPSIADVEEDCTLCTSSTLITESGNDFRTKVSECIDGTCPEGVPIGCWNTSDVTDMSYAFKATGSFEKTYFNTSINCWNTARVTTMAGMFFGASKFNQPLDDWNVASVTEMSYMFLRATNFNQPLDDWNVASVTTMFAMFNQ